MEITLNQVKDSLRESLQIMGYEMTPDMCLCCSEHWSKDIYMKLKFISNKYYGDLRMMKRFFFQEQFNKLMPEKLKDGERFIGFKLENGIILAQIGRYESI